MTHPWIQDAAVTGKVDVKSGEVPVAFIVRKPEAISMVTEQEIIDYVAGIITLLLI